MSNHLLASLTPREERVLRMLFGIGTDTAYTREEIGQRLNLTGARIGQIEREALRKLGKLINLGAAA
jgi:RNA polymerase primary sigma factor